MWFHKKKKNTIAQAPGLRTRLISVGYAKEMWRAQPEILRRQRQKQIPEKRKNTRRNQKFSDVSAPVYFLCQVTKERHERERERERELFSGTQFSNLYTEVDTPAGDIYSM